MEIIIHCGALASDIREESTRDHGVARAPLRKVKAHYPVRSYGDYIIDLPDDIGVLMILKYSPQVCRAEDAR